MTPKHVMVVMGTRPEAIKQAPVIWAMRARPETFKVTVVSTGQHREMLRPVLDLFDLVLDVDLGLMREDQTLADLASRCIDRVDTLLRDRRPDVVAVQGDTTTAMAAALAAFYRRIPIAHVEAGLRSGSLEEPFPEEGNRLVTDAIGRWLFAPTRDAANQLRDEGIPDELVYVTGNTVVDALQRVRPRLGSVHLGLGGLPDEVGLRGRLVLVTCHRRESFGPVIEGICNAVARLARQYPDVDFVYPVHMNPNVRRPVHRLLGGLKNVLLCPPVRYDVFLALLSRAALVLTDSGGVQEEAPSFGVPILVLRNRTERPEGVAAGCAELVGTSEDHIVEAAARHLSSDAPRDATAIPTNPYGDGNAGERIATILRAELASDEVVPRRSIRTVGGTRARRPVTQPALAR